MNPDFTPLIIRDDDRYARLRLISWWDQERLASATFLVAGIGALGNELCKNLAMVGAGTLVIVDFDTVEISNLSRAVLFRPGDAGRSKAEVAAERIRELNPDVRVISLHADVMGELGLGWIREADIVLGALDNREARLGLNRYARRLQTPWIDGGIQEIAGQVRVFHPAGACYECGMNASDYAQLNLRYSCPGLPRADIEAGKVPTTPTVSSIIAGLQVQEALKILHGLRPEGSQALLFNGTTNLFYTSDLVPREDCLSHEIYPEPRSLPFTSRETSATELLTAVASETGGSPVLELDRDLITQFTCPRCDDVENLVAPLFKIRASSLVCPRCGEERSPRTEHRIPMDSPLASHTLGALGIPPYDIVRIATDAGPDFVLLAGDGREGRGTG
ncbi:MAG: HesA/MoeB/ThiF family protein [Planctomycetota bacterium]